jgi:hypothetical protein
VFVHIDENITAWPAALKEMIGFPAEDWIMYLSEYIGRAGPVPVLHPFSPRIFA